MFDGILEMFSEKKSALNGHTSMMRVITMFVVVVIMFNWTWHNIATGEMHPLDWQNIAMMIGVLTTKVIQKKFESNKE